MRAKDAREIAEFAMKQKDIAHRKEQEELKAILLETAKKEFPHAIKDLYQKISEKAKDGEIYLEIPDSYSETLAELIKKDLAENGFTCSIKSTTRDFIRTTSWNINW